MMTSMQFGQYPVMLAQMQQMQQMPQFVMVQQQQHQQATPEQLQQMLALQPLQVQQMQQMQQLQQLHRLQQQQQLAGLKKTSAEAVPAGMPALGAAEDVGSLSGSSGPSAGEAVRSRGSEEVFPPATLRVSATTKLGSLGGSIAKRVRGGQVVVVEAMGALSVERTVAALRLASSFLEGDSTLRVRCSFMRNQVDEEGVNPGLRFHCYGLVDADTPPVAGEAVSVNGPQPVGRTAGTLARKLRACAMAGTGFVLRMGHCAESANTAVKGLALARSMLVEEQLDVIFEMCPAPNRRQRKAEPPTCHVFPTSVDGVRA